MKNERCWYILLLVCVLGLAFALAYPFTAYGQEESTDDWIPVPGVVGAKFVKAGNAMRISVSRPLLRDRYAAYGRVIADPNGVLKPDLSADKLLTNKGREIYRRLMSMTTKTGLFAIYSVAVHHAHIDIIKYGSADWDNIESQVFKILKQVLKK